MIGRVVSTKMQKSAVVLVEENKKHPLYGKIYLRTKKFLVDDPFNVKDGDVVEIVKVRPISKNKHYQIKKVLGSDIVSLETAQLQAGAEEAIAEVVPEKVQSPSTQTAQGEGESEEKMSEAPVSAVEEKTTKSVRKLRVAKKETK